MTYKDRQTDRQAYIFWYNCFFFNLIRKVPQSYENKFANVTDENRRKFLGMLNIMDESVGNLTSALERLGYLEDTIIFFTSDVSYSFEQLSTISQHFSTISLLISS